LAPNPHVQTLPETEVDIHSLPGLHLFVSMVLPIATIQDQGVEVSIKRERRRESLHFGHRGGPCIGKPKVLLCLWITGCRTSVTPVAHPRRHPGPDSDGQADIPASDGGTVDGGTAGSDPNDGAACAGCDSSPKASRAWWIPVIALLASTRRAVD
jgi:hypothetical protein